jgi:hypothetical protein
MKTSFSVSNLRCEYMNNLGIDAIEPRELVDQLRAAQSQQLGLPDLARMPIRINPLGKAVKSIPIVQHM